MKVGFVNLFGKPNGGKSTLLNAIMGEKIAIVSHKVQTTRHQIKAILLEKDYQIIFSDTPGIIEPKYKLHEKMMQAVKRWCNSRTAFAGQLYQPFEKELKKSAVRKRNFHKNVYYCSYS